MLNRLCRSIRGARFLWFLLAVLVVGTAGCSTSQAGQSASGGSPTLGSSRLAAQPRQVCFGPMPAQWSKLAGADAVLQNIEFSVMAVDGDGNAYGAYKRGTEFGVAEFGARFTMIDSMPSSASGPAWMSYRKPWLVWVQGDSQYKLGMWSVHGWNSVTEEKLKLGDSKLVDGTYLENDLTFPVVGDGFVAWSTPTTETSGDVRLYRFDTHESTTLDSGHVSSPVIAGHNLVWAKFTTDQTKASFQMLDVRTLAPVAVPAPLKKPQPISHLAGSNDYLAWTAYLTGTSPEGAPTFATSLTVDRLSTGQLTQYRLTEGDALHYFQFPILAGHFLVWFTATQNSVLDLQTGKGFDIKLPSSVVGNDHQITVARTSGGGSKLGGPGPADTAVSTIQLSGNLAISSCAQ
jgi:hypothetical protein